MKPRSSLKATRKHCNLLLLLLFYCCYDDLPLFKSNKKLMPEPIALPLNQNIQNLVAHGGASFDRINRINKIFLYRLYLPAGRQVLNILS